MLDAAGIDFEFQFPEEYPELEIGGDERRNIFLCVKEIVNNAIKHSKANMVKIFLSIHQNYLSLIISDNGSGFNRQSLPKTGNGLKNLIKRTESLNGKLVIDSENGTIINMEFPIKNFNH